MTTRVENIAIRRTESSRINEVDFDNLSFGNVFSDHMVSSEYKDGVWGVPEIMPFQNLSVAPSLSALHYGCTVFEGLKAFRNSDDQILLFRPEMHAKRINISAERLCMPAFPVEYFLESLKRLLELDKAWIPNKQGCSLYIRPLMFASDEYLGVAPSRTHRLLIFTSPVGKYYDGSVKVKVETEYTRAAEGGTGFIKMGGNYAASLLPALKANQQGYDQIIWTDGKSHEKIEEAGTMNIMFMIGDTLVTPKTSSSILGGITRLSVIDLARKWGINVEERDITVSEIADAYDAGTLNDAFGTGTAATVTHISVINHNGRDMILPAESDREFSNKVRDYLSKLKMGLEEDYMGWMTKIN